MTELADRLFKMAGSCYNYSVLLEDETAYAESSKIAEASAGKKLYVTHIIIAFDTPSEPLNIGHYDGDTTTTIFTSIQQGGQSIMPINLQFFDCPYVLDPGDQLRVDMAGAYTVHFMVRGYEVPV